MNEFANLHVTRKPKKKCILPPRNEDSFESLRQGLEKDSSFFVACKTCYMRQVVS